MRAAPSFASGMRLPVSWKSRLRSCGRLLELVFGQDATRVRDNRLTANFVSSFSTRFFHEESHV